MASLSDIQFRLSGDTTNDTPESSLGGAMSTLSAPSGVIQSNNAVDSAPITGITVIDAPQSAVGTGVLTFTASGTLATWAPAGQSAGAAVNVGTAGSYTLYGLDGTSALRISTSGSLPGVDDSTNVVVTRAAGRLFDAVSAEQSIAGHVDYRCIYLNNVGASTLANIQIYIPAQPAGATMAIGLDPVGVGGTATTIALETDAPAGVTFTSPSSAATGLLVASLTAANKVAIWVRRTVPANSTATGTSAVPIAFTIGVAFT